MSKFDRGPMHDVVDASLAKKKILSVRDERVHEKTHEAHGNDRAYVVELRSGDRSADLIGSIHGSDPENAIILDVQGRLDTFIETHKDVVLMIEGHHSGIDRERAEQLLEEEGVTSSAEAVRRFGEGGLAMWRAVESKLEITSPEMPDEDILETLGTEFSAEDITTYLVLRDLTSWVGHHYDRELSVRDVAFAMHRYQLLTGVDWISDTKTREEGEKMTPEEIDAYAEKIGNEFIEKLNEHAKQLLNGKEAIPSMEAVLERRTDEFPLDQINENVDPAHEGSVINDISMKWNALRDEYLVDAVARAKTSGKDVLMIFGSSHIAAIEPAVRELYR